MARCRVSSQSSAAYRSSSVASATFSSAASVVLCQSRVVASFEQGKRIRWTSIATTRSRWRDGFVASTTLQAEFADHLEHGLDVAVREGAEGAEGFVGGDERFALEAAADQFDGGRGQVREIAEGFVEDFVALAVGASEEVGL